MKLKTTDDIVSFLNLSGAEVQKSGIRKEAFVISREEGNGEINLVGGKAGSGKTFHLAGMVIDELQKDGTVLYLSEAEDAKGIVDKMILVDPSLGTLSHESIKRAGLEKGGLFVEVFNESRNDSNIVSKYEDFFYDALEKVENKVGTPSLIIFDAPPAILNSIEMKYFVERFKNLANELNCTIALSAQTGAFFED